MDFDECYRLATEHSNEGVIIVSGNKRLFINQRCIELAGHHTAQEFDKIPFLSTVHPDDRKKVKEIIRKRQSGKPAPSLYEFRFLRPDGSIIYVEVSACFITYMGQPASLGYLRDISDRKQIEEKYRTILEDMEEGYFEIDLKGNFTFVNDAECRNMGYSREELIGMNNRQYSDEENAKKAFQAFSNLYKTGESCQIFDYEVTRKDGTKVISELLVSLIKDSKGKPIGFRGLSRHITERKQAEEALRKSEEKYRLVVENAKEGIIIAQDVKLVFVNRATVDMIGYSGEILASKPFTDFIHPDDRNMVVDYHIRRLKGEEVPLAYSFRVINQDGTVKWVEFNTAVIQWNERPATLSFLNDITERKQAEDALRRSEEKYRNILENMQEGYFELDLAGNFTFINDAECRNMGYPREELIGINNRQYQDKTTAQKTYQLFRRLYRTGEPVKASDVEIIRKNGTKSFNEISVSLIRDSQGKPIGFRGISRDITERKQAEDERKQSFQRMRKALGATVQAISMTVEMKDPYTSGHQQRVSDLARSMATEMGLSADQRDFIRTASSIHDIGKIAIPTEILSKPTKLTDLEFNLIKTHAQSGYDILKDIEFPWPVADVVLQHHERMDGSGYPQGLKGDDILLEARIMAVADVVESMASHRPYRPSLGIEAALEEIEKNKGILYDKTVGDACLRLFREKSYQLP
jgi:PAS domain S-box-containing protein